MIRVAWIAALVAFGAVALRLLHLVLMRQHLDDPVVVAGWTGTTWVLAAAVVGLSRTLPPDRRGFLSRHCAARGRLPWLAVFLVLLFAFHWGYERAASDGREYFVQLRSAVMDGDLDFSNENEAFGVRGFADRYPVGGPLLWAPFYVAADLWFALLNLFGADIPRDGYANPYQQAVGLATLVYGFAGLVLVARLLRDYFSRAITVAAVAGICLGTFLLWYLVVDNSMVHAMSMFAVTLFVFIWYRTYGRRTPWQWALLGAAGGLMALVRWQNVGFLLFPAVEALIGYARALLPAGARQRLPGDAVTGSAADGRRGSALPGLLLRHGVFVLGGLLAFLPQLLFWNRVRGDWAGLPAKEHGVDFAVVSPSFMDALYSAQKGLFSWTPLVYLAVLGLPLLILGNVEAPVSGRSRRVSPALLGGLLLGAFAAQAYVNGLVVWRGHGFGGRGFTNCVLVFAFGLAAVLAWMRRHPMVAPALLLGGLVVVNLQFMRAVQTGRLQGSDSVSYRQILDATLEHVGNPFMFPANAWFAWRHGSDLAMYERIGEQRFNNLPIDLGAPDDGRFLARGWSGREGRGDFTFRWAVGPESAIVAPLRRSVEYEVALTCAPLGLPGAPLQVMEVRFNGELLERLALRRGMRTYRLRVPAELVREGYNDLVFRYEYSASPRSLVDSSKDDRELAVQFDRVELLRRS